MKQAWRNYDHYWAQVMSNVRFITQFPLLLCVFEISVKEKKTNSSFLKYLTLSKSNINNY